MRQKRRWLCCFAAVAASILLTGCPEDVAPQTEPTSPATEQATQPVQQDPSGEPLGYRDTAALEDGFYAVGTQGRIDFIFPDGTVEACQSGTTATISGVCLVNGMVVASAEDGTVLWSEDGRTFTVQTVAQGKTLVGITQYGGLYYTADDQGTIYASQDLVSWTDRRFEGVDALIGITATNQCVVAVSETSDIVMSFDGLEWSHMNYDEKYDGLSMTYGFQQVVSAGETFFILGYRLDNPNVPAVLYSDTGEVWMEKPLMEINGQVPTGEQLLRLYDLGVDIDQLYAPANDGQVVTITSCVVCNEMRALDGAQGRLMSISVTPDVVLVAGDGYYFQIIDRQELRQDRIQAEQAWADVQYNGAVLIDVREADELEEYGYIPGSLHIPLAQVQASLTQQVPDLNTELIFYCASGKRSAQAAEMALELGYETVYNLGGLSDWPYEIATAGE